MHNVAPLSSGSLIGQTLNVEPVEPDNDRPNAVVVRCRQKPTISTLASFDHVAADAIKVLSNAWLNSPRSVCGKVVTAQASAPGHASRGACLPRAGSIHRSALRNLIPRSKPTRVQRSNASKSNGLPS
jgi:hypothetical protein